MMKMVDITGKRYGRLVAVEFDHGDKGKAKYWRCKCDCGSEKVVAYTHLQSGGTSSCGCFKKERQPFANRTHGYSRRGSAEYHAWVGMRSRCGDPKNKDYPSYGGRGIKVCDAWSDFQRFLDDVGARPSAEHSLDRIDVNGDYSRGNCRWATDRQQRMNKRNTVFIEVDGVQRSLIDVCQERGVLYPVAWRRWKAGHNPFERIQSVHWRHRITAITA